MGNGKTSVLLIAETAQGSSYLPTRMQTLGCKCSFASSRQDAFLILRDQKFDLVLSLTSLRDGTLYPIMSLLEGSGATLFFCCVVEDGCWWLPALRCGQKCFGSPALLPSEFVMTLDKTIEEIQVATAAAQEDKSLLVFRADGSVMASSRQPPKSRAANPARTEMPELVKRKAAG